MTTFALGALVAYRPEWTPPEAVDGWLRQAYRIIAIRTYRHIERPVQVHYTLLPATGDPGDWWHLRPIALVRSDQLRPYPPARCRDCGVVLQPHASTSTACGECATWARHLQPQGAP